MARQSSISAAFSVALVFLTYASSTAVIAAEEPNHDTSHNHQTTTATAGTSLRGNQQTSSSPELPIPMDDVRRTTDPFTLAAARDRRELANGEKRQQRKQERMQANSFSNNDDEGHCSGSSPNRCGCPNVYQSDYRGNLGTTQHGLSCRSWTMAANYPDSGLEDGAVCRNPEGVADRAWCFVDHPDVSFDYCDVRGCEDDGFSVVSSGNTVGTNVNVPGCVTTARYYAIGDDIAEIANDIDNDKDRSHFVGGVLRLAAHDFMDFDQNDSENPMGMDGCLDWDSSNNSGLSSIWNEHSALFHLHEEKYPDISRADFWVMAANAIIRITSIDNSLDLKPTFYWGRKEANVCPGAAARLPTTENCQQVEGVFLERMGLKWTDAVALLGAHTLGRGHSEFSGHHGTWVPNDRAAQVFDKRYYQELVSRAWSPRQVSIDPPLLDWTTGNPNTDRPKMMLNTDICLMYNIEESATCCTRTSIFDDNGRNRCESESENECARYDTDHSHWEASKAVMRYLGGSSENDNNQPFYEAFKLAWFKATMNGMDNLKPVEDSC